MASVKQSLAGGGPPGRSPHISLGLQRHRLLLQVAGSPSVCISEGAPSQRLGSPQPPPALPVFRGGCGSGEVTHQLLGLQGHVERLLHPREAGVEGAPVPTH